jgi:hypothetical protein
MKRRPIPQHELAGADQVFHLASDTAVDGDRLQREREQAVRDKETARQLEQKQQPQLL